MAPPLLARSHGGQAPRKLRLGSWLEPLLRVLAHGKVLRGRWCDPFGHTAERRMERSLIADYLQQLDALLPLLTPSTLALAEQWALVPLQMRGFGHVKQANVAQAQRRSAELLHRLAPQHFARPAPADAPAAGQFKGIRITQSSYINSCSRLLRLAKSRF